jgi:hypothetical protein
LIRASARTDELQALANRYGTTRFDRANAEFQCTELDELRMSFKIYKERGWIPVGKNGRRLDVRRAIDHLSDMFPGFCW